MSSHTDQPTSTTTRSEMRRVVASSFLGSLIEYYDFLLYSTASALVFNKVFFANLDPVTGTIASFGTFAAGYLARPLGGVVFGHFGDRVGRKKMLILTMVVMAVVSTLIGCLPTYAQVGALAPVLLTVLRVLQGVAVGGEWGGAVLMSAEHGDARRRGLWASFTNAGAPAGTLTSTAVLAVVAAVTSNEQFLAWGWRIPFLLSLVLLGVGLWVRLSVSETPAFRQLKDANPAAHIPLVDVFRNHPRTLALAVGVGLGAFVAQGTLTTFVLSYGAAHGHSRPAILNTFTISSAVAVVGIIGWAALSDRIGRRPVIVMGALAMAVYAFFLFAMVRDGSWGMLLAAIVIGQGVIHPAIYGPLAALNSELFSTESRYTGASLGYQIAGMGAGLAPMIFAAIQKSTPSSTPLSVIIAAFCLLTVLCVLLLSETRNRDLIELRREPDDIDFSVGGGL